MVNDFLVEEDTKLVSNCCGAVVKNEICQDCKEHCQAVEEEEIEFYGMVGRDEGGYCKEDN
jgi:hypothetical protein